MTRAEPSNAVNYYRTIYAETELVARNMASQTTMIFLKASAEYLDLSGLAINDSGYREVAILVTDWPLACHGNTQLQAS